MITYESYVILSDGLTKRKYTTETSFQQPYLTSLRILAQVPKYMVVISTIYNMHYLQMTMPINIKRKCMHISL
jgi:hypothetical protein